MQKRTPKWSCMKLVKYLSLHNSLKILPLLSRLQKYRNTDTDMKHHSPERKKLPPGVRNRSSTTETSDDLAVGSFMVTQRLTLPSQAACGFSA